MGKKSKNIKLKKILTTKTFISITILIILTLILYTLILQNILTNPFLEFSNKEVIYNAEDRCSIIVGQMIHTINDKDSCSNICISLCKADNKKLIKSDFIEKINSCHECKCHCK